MRDSKLLLRTGVLAVSLALVASVPCAADLEEDIVGDWSFLQGGAAFVVSFNANGTYSLAATLGGAEIYGEAGTYTVSGDEITVLPESSSDPESIGVETVFVDVSIADETLSMFDPEGEMTVVATRGTAPEVAIEPGTGVVSGTISVEGPELPGPIVVLLFDEEGFALGSENEEPVVVSYVPESGEYRVVNVPPGRYIALAVVQPEERAEDEGPDAVGVHGGLMSPVAVEVRADEEAAGIDIAIQRFMAAVSPHSWGQVKASLR